MSIIGTQRAWKQDLPNRKEISIEVSSTANHLRSYLEKQGVQRSLTYCLAGFLKHWVAKRLCGEKTIYPGNKRVADWGRVKERQTQNNVKSLEEFGIITRVRYEYGGRGRASEFVVSAKAIRRYLIDQFNPSKQLLEKLEKLEHYDPKPCTPSYEKGVLSLAKRVQKTVQ